MVAKPLLVPEIGDPGSNPGWLAVIKLKLIFLQKDMYYKAYDQSDNQL